MDIELTFFTPPYFFQASHLQSSIVSLLKFILLNIFTTRLWIQKLSFLTINKLPIVFSYLFSPSLECLVKPLLEESSTIIVGGEENLTIDAKGGEGVAGGFGNPLVDASNNLALLFIPSWKIYTIYKKTMSNLHKWIEFKML
jgi:hypothetical protein